MSNEANALTTFNPAIPFSTNTDIAPPKPKRKYPPQLKFLANNDCSEVKAGKAKAGGYCLIKDGEVTDLGKEVTVIPFVRLDKGLDKRGEKTTAAFQQTEPEKYAEILQAVIDDGYDSNCMAGPFLLHFLVDTEEFVTQWLYSGSGRQEISNIEPYLPVTPDNATKDSPARAATPCVLGVGEATSTPRGKSREYTYNVPETSNFSGQLEVENPLTQEDLQKACDSFIKQAYPRDAQAGDSDTDADGESRSR